MEVRASNTKCQGFAVSVLNTVLQKSVLEVILGKCVSFSVKRSCIHLDDFLEITFNSHIYWKQMLSCISCLKKSSDQY